MNTSFSSQGSFADYDEDDVATARLEGELYLSIPVLKLSSFTQENPFKLLDWWKANAATFPKLAQVAKDVFAVQVSQTGVERVFNISKDVIGDRRHRLSAKTISQIMFIKMATVKELAALETDMYTEHGEETLDEDNPPNDEVDDLLGLRAGSGDEEEGHILTEVNTWDKDSPPRTPRTSLRKRKRTRHFGEPEVGVGAAA
jgi:hypothetical protein